MKKSGILLIIVFCFFMTGCSNKFAENEYDSVEKIIEKCTRGIREKRYFSMREVKRELERWEKKCGKMFLALSKIFRKRDFQWYQEKSIICTEGNHSFYIAKRLMILTFFLLAIMMPKRKLNVVLRDQEMRKVLVKQGCAYETSTNLLLEIPWEEIEGENCRIIVECKDQGVAKKKVLHRLCFGKLRICK